MHERSDELSASQVKSVGAYEVRSIDRPGLHTEITARLARLVASALPGSKLPTERKLAETLGVGRSTLREALRALSFVGAISIRQGDGIYVSRSANADGARLVGLGFLANRATVREIVEVRQLLEIEAAGKAAMNHQPEDRTVLEDIMEHFERARGEPLLISQLDVDFHVALARATHNSALSYLVTGMRGVLGLWLTRSIGYAHDHDRIATEHASILEAVIRRDSAAAELLMTGHLANASRALLKISGAEDMMLDYVSGVFGCDLNE